LKAALSFMQLRQIWPYLRRSENRFEYAAADRQRFVGNGEAVFAPGARVEIADFHAGIDPHPLVDQAAQHTGKWRDDARFADRGDELSRFDAIANRCMRRHMPGDRS